MSDAGLMLPSRVYPVVDSACRVERLTAWGAKLIQLRVKSDDLALLRREIRAAQAFCLAAGAVLVVNDHWRLAIEAGGGFHPSRPGGSRHRRPRLDP